MPQTHYLVHAQHFNFIGDSNLAFASYPGYCYFGSTLVDGQSQSYFDTTRSLRFSSVSFFNLIRSIKMAKDKYVNDPEGHFTLDLLPPKKTEPKNKITATFSKNIESQDESSLFQLRNQWRFRSDPHYHKELNEGKREPIEVEGDYVFTKRGVVCLPSIVDELELILEKHLLATCTELDYSEGKKMIEFVDFGISHFGEELRDFLDNYHGKKLKDKKDFIDRILMEMIKSPSGFNKEDSFKLKQLKDKLVDEESLLFSVFMLKFNGEKS